MPEQNTLFDLPSSDARKLSRFPALRDPIWTRNKARLIERYLHFFVMITRHGVYIDGFAGPQRRNDEDAWAAKLVLESQPAWLRKFLMIDADQRCFNALKNLKSAQPPVRGREITIWHGDFNVLVSRMLRASGITEKTASFCLLDQRTFECHWSTVRKVAMHKTSKKIEIFYFFGTSWLDRAISGTKNLDRVKDWWGSENWEDFLNASRTERPRLLSKRFEDELGYTSAAPWPIYDANERVMYHMIHATDHAEAPKLMARAYRKIMDTDGQPAQLELELLDSKENS